MLRGPLLVAFSLGHAAAFSAPTLHRVRLSPANARVPHSPTALAQEAAVAATVTAPALTPDAAAAAGWDSGTTALLADGGFLGAIFGALGNVVGGVLWVHGDLARARR